MLDSPLTTSLQILFGLPFGLGPSTSYSVHFFTQSSYYHLVSKFQTDVPLYSVQNWFALIDTLQSRQDILFHIYAVVLNVCMWELINHGPL